MSMIPYLFDLERPFHMMQRQFFSPENFFGYSPFQLAQSNFQNFFEPRRLMNLENTIPWNIIRPMEQLSAAMNQLALTDSGTKITADDEKFQVNVDVQHFTPEEVNVKVVNGQVIVEGKHEERIDEHGYISRHFVRKYALPKGCLPDTVESKLSSDGVLTVTAPKVLAMPSTGERIVPITHTGPIQKQLGSPDVVQESAKDENK